VVVEEQEMRQCQCEKRGFIPFQRRVCFDGGGHVKLVITDLFVLRDSRRVPQTPTPLAPQIVQIASPFASCYFHHSSLNHHLTSSTTNLLLLPTLPPQSTCLPSPPLPPPATRNLPPPLERPRPSLRVREPRRLPRRYELVSYVLTCLADSYPTCAVCASC
jgi:hypothetical protein